MKEFPKLFKRASTGAVQEWTIIADGPGYITRAGQVGGKIKGTAPHYCEPKNIGKANESTPETQAVIEAEAVWSKKLKEGYTEDINLIDLTGFKKPMKGEKYLERMDEVVFPVMVQNKLNGIRCQSEAERSYSTGGETFHNILHIRQSLAMLFMMWPDMFLDGELYNFIHRKNLNRLIKLVSVVMKPKDITDALREESRNIVQLHLWDGYGFMGITKDTPYPERLKAVRELIAGSGIVDMVQVMEFTMVNSHEELMALFEKTAEWGGEGVMIRYGDCLFKHTRVPYLLKLKHFDDDEYLVVGVEEGKGDWAGAVKKLILQLNTPATNATKDTTFKSNVVGSREKLTYMFNHPESIIGKKVTCVYQQLSEFGIPQIPWVYNTRDYE